MKFLALTTLLTAGLVFPTTVAASSDATKKQIGRLNYAGFKSRGHCTVSLIGKQTALTAKHCIDAFPADAIKIVLGYDRGEWLELHQIRKLWTHPTADIALLCLKKNSKLPPLALETKWFKSKLVKARVQGYRRSRPHLQTTLVCTAQKKSGRIRMECPAEPGMSGSPVFVGSNTIIGVMSQSGLSFSLADSVLGLPKNICQ